MTNFTELESQRQVIQSKLDNLKSQKERNIMGQFSTPIILANSIIEYAKKIIPKGENIRFLDPAFGTGVFFSALNNIFSSEQIETATGYEIDEHYGNPASTLWSNTYLNYQLADFTKATPPIIEEEKFNLLICNPPYVRHHYINGQKERLSIEALNAANMKLSGLAGLYCYFIALSHRWMKSNGIAGWLIPSEFMEVNYGKSIKNYLLNEVTLLQIHRFDPKDIQFDDALVSSAIVWFKNKKPNKNHSVKFTYGGTLNAPHHEREIASDILALEKKWTRFPISEVRIENNFSKLSDFFIIRRGIATGDNKFFILTQEQIEKFKLPIEQFHPILPSPRYLPEIIIHADQDGNPEIKNQLFILDCKLPMNEIKQLYPHLYNYLQLGNESGVSKRYLCKNRKLWYEQERRSESTFYCTYIGRSDKEGSKPFRFILNHSKAIVTNSYLILYPKEQLLKIIEQNPSIKDKLFITLNQIDSSMMLDEGRVYGGGLHKLEPSELANIPANEIETLIAKFKMNSSTHKEKKLYIKNAITLPRRSLSPASS